MTGSKRKRNLPWGGGNSIETVESWVTCSGRERTKENVKRMGHDYWHNIKTGEILSCKKKLKKEELGREKRSGIMNCQKVNRTEAHCVRAARTQRGKRTDGD